MKSLWSEATAAKFTTDLGLRVYTSNLLGTDDTLVLHGGGNTSVKSTVNGETILYVKGSGWDLVSIEEEGFAPVKLDVLQDMAKKTSMTDTQMVSGQRAAMTNPDAPNPSVEAILHAIIPFKYVDHTHADAVVTISNSIDGKSIIAKLFPNFLIIDYVMPGFILAQTIYEQTKDFDWSTCEGIILHHHGIFTFDDDARHSYEKMVSAVTIAEKHLQTYATLTMPEESQTDVFDIGNLQQHITQHKGYDVVCQLDQSPLARMYASQPHLSNTVTRGVLTPEHIIRTKRIPLVLHHGEDISSAIQSYKENYTAYFDHHATSEVMLNPSPNYAVVEAVGLIYFGKTQKEASIIADIIQHTMLAVLRADKLGTYQSIDEAQSFAMEYWELEQAKIKKTDT